MNRLMRTLVGILAAVALAGCASLDGRPSHKAVYHLNAGLDQASNALRNINNHLGADPRAKIIVVTHAAGIDFLIDGAKDKNGNPFEIPVQQLAAKGVEFRVCRNTLTSRKIPESKVIPEATIVPSGVAEVARLQAEEGFAYLRI